MVTGRVAELEAVPNAVTIAFPMFAMNLEDEGEGKYVELNLAILKEENLSLT